MSLQAEFTAVGRRHDPLLDQPHHAGRGLLGIVDEGPRPAAWNQGAVGHVAAVDEGLRGEGDARIGRCGLEGGARQPHQNDALPQRAHGAGDGLRHPGVLGRLVVHRPMRLHVLELDPLGAADGGERARLIERIGIELVRRAGHAAPPEPHQVGIPRVCADGHARGPGRTHGPEHHHGVAGMPSAGHVRGGDGPHYLLVHAHPPVSETLAQIAVQVDVQIRESHPGRAPFQSVKAAVLPLVHRAAGAIVPLQIRHGKAESQEKTSLLFS